MLDDHTEVNELAGLVHRPYQGRHRQDANVANLAQRLDGDCGS